MLALCVHVASCSRLHTAILGVCFGQGDPRADNAWWWWWWLVVMVVVVVVVGGDGGWW